MTEPEFMRLLDVLAADARAEIKAMAEHARRSLGQINRRDREKIAAMVTNGRK